MSRINKTSHHSVHLAGVSEVISQLSLLGFDAKRAVGRTKGADILVSDPRSGSMFKMVVKTSTLQPMYNRLFGYFLYWMLSEKHEKLIDPNLFYCFVNQEKPTNLLRFFIVPSIVVATYVKVEHQRWLKHRKDQEKEDFPMRHFRIGLDDNEKKI